MHLIYHAACFVAFLCQPCPGDNMHYAARAAAELFRLPVTLVTVVGSLTVTAYMRLHVFASTGDKLNTDKLDAVPRNKLEKQFADLGMKCVLI